jgi:hypothetical protein
MYVTYVTGGKPKGKRLQGGSKLTWVDNIKMDLDLGGMAWIGLTHDRDQWRAFVDAVMNLLDA